MKRSFVIAFLFFFFLGNASGKPSLPLQVNAELSNDPSKEGVAEIRVLVNSSIDLQGVTVQARLPLGAVLSSGKYEWKGDIGKGEVKELLYTLSVNPEVYYKVEFLVKMNAFRIKGSAFSIVDINPSKKKVESRTQGRIRRLPDGSPVIETRGE